MFNQLYMLWLSDGMKPRKMDDCFITSRGKAPLDNKEKTTAYNFLSHQQALGKVTFYDTNYDVFHIYSNQLDFDMKSIEQVSSKDYYLTQNGYLIYFGNSDTFIEYILDEDCLYLFDFSGDYEPLISIIVGSNNIQEVYSKKPLIKTSEIIRFFFIGREIVTDYFVVKEGQRYGLLGNYASSMDFEMGSWKFKTGTHFEMPLLMWPRKKIEGKNLLEEVTYFSFIQEISTISEFDYDVAISELSPVSSMGGRFYFMKKDDKIIGFACAEKEASTFIYVSYLAIKKDYRKTEASKQLLDSLKIIAKSKEMNLILTIEVHKLLDFYRSHGFKIVDQWRFE